MFKVLIVGAGLSGLTCSIALARHSNIQVTILERAPVLDKAGNGIQIPCNAAHAMRSLGLLDQLLTKSRRSGTAGLALKYSDEAVLVAKDFSQYEDLYGAPWLLIHRADYMTVLLEEAERLGVELKLGCEVRQIDFDMPRLRLANGTVHEADIVVGSDGIHSTVRSLIHPSIKPLPTGEFAYRAIFKRSQLSSPRLQHLIATPGVSRYWWGPHANVVFYPLQDGALFNLVIVISHEEFNESCAIHGRQGRKVIDLVRNWLRDGGWNTTLLELLDAADDDLLGFPFLQVPVLPFWSKGQVTLSGDAAHAIFPYLAQGAATGVEDGYILGTLLGLFSERVLPPSERPTKHQVKRIIASYEKLQYERTARIVSNSRLTGILEHLPLGPDQRARDAEFATFNVRTSVSALPWIDARINMEMLGRRAGDVVDEEFGRLLAEGKLGGKARL